MFPPGPEIRSVRLLPTFFCVFIQDSDLLILDDPYVVLYRILSDHFSKEDVNTMRRTLCQSSFEVSSWQNSEPNKHDRLASAYSYVFNRRG
jgi:hypothetical protein